MYCSTCGDERLFEQPPCPDGHGGECPERACVECGTAVLAGLPPAVPADLRPAAHRGTGVRGGSTAHGAPTPSSAASSVSVPVRTATARAAA